MLPTPRIDCHAHVHSDAMPLAPDAWHRPPEEATIEQFMAEMATLAVGRAVLSASSLFGFHNDYALAATRRHADLRTTVIVDPETSRDDLGRFDAAGAVGIRLQLRNKPHPDLDSRQYRELLRHARDLDWHIELHDDLARLPPLIAAIERTGVRLVIDHFGRPEDLDAVLGPNFDLLLRAVARGGTWVKVSAGFRLQSAAVVETAFARLIEIGGPERLLWGSDWPFAGYEGRTDYAREVRSYQAFARYADLIEAIDRTAGAFYFGEE